MAASAPAPTGAYSTYGLGPPMAPLPAPYGPGPAAYVGPPPLYAAPAYPSPYGYAPPPPGYAPPAVYGYPVGYAPAVPVPYAVAFAREAAGSRIAAGLIDAVIVFGFWLVLFLFVYPSVFAFPAAFVVRIPLTLLWILGYYAAMDGLAGGTVGKAGVGLTLVNKDLTPIRPSQALVRSLEIFVWILAGGIILLLIQYSMVQDGGQGVGDKLAKCYLVPRARVGRIHARAARTG